MTRLAAWQILRSGSDTPTLEVSRYAEEEQFEPRDRALLRRIVGTEVRRRGTLRAMVRRLCRGKPTADMKAHIHIGLVQLYFLDQVPDHAAVSETVRTASDTLGLSKGRYVNAVLREAIRKRTEGSSGDATRDLIGRELSFEDRLFHDPTEQPLLWAEDALSVPASLLKRWVKRWGEEEAFALARTFLSEPDLSLRCAPAARAELQAELSALGIELREGVHPDVLILPSSESQAVLQSEAFGSGRISVQGETAFRAAELTGAEEGEHWLDLCAAPGGKTSVLAARGARVLACDVSPGKMQRLGETIERQGLGAGVELRELTDGEPPAETGFDGALVDAPCSNTGVLGARPDARWRFGPSSQKGLTELQARLLAAAAERVRPGGKLVYSTCSLEGDENRQQIRRLLETQPGWKLEEEIEARPAPCGSAGPVDGGYAARLRKN